jgi:hypothetical protein
MAHGWEVSADQEQSLLIGLHRILNPVHFVKRKALSQYRMMELYDCLTKSGKRQDFHAFITTMKDEVPALLHSKLLAEGGEFRRCSTPVELYMTLSELMLRVQSDTIIADVRSMKASLERGTRHFVLKLSEQIKAAIPETCWSISPLAKVLANLMDEGIAAKRDPLASLDSDFVKSGPSKFRLAEDLWSSVPRESDNLGRLVKSFINAYTR